jgi:hypothetical protein
MSQSFDVVEYSVEATIYPRVVGAVIRAAIMVYVCPLTEVGALCFCLTPLLLKSSWASRTAMVAGVFGLSEKNI